MRKIEEIDQHIRFVENTLKRLHLERKLTLLQIEGIRASSELITKRAIKQMMECGK